MLPLLLVEATILNGADPSVVIWLDRLKVGFALLIDSIPGIVAN